MKTKEKIDFDKLIQEHILNGKHVIIERHNNEKQNNEIVSVDSFTTKEEFKKVAQTYFHEDMDFLTAEEAYIRECNSNYYHYLEELAEGRQGDTDLETRDNFKKEILSYDEFNKDIDRKDFVDGFYEWTTLFAQVNFPEPTKIKYDSNFRFENSEETIKGEVTIEIY